MNRRGGRARLPLLIGLLLLLALIPFALFRGSQAPEAEAAWWNESWQYRQSIAVTNNTTQQTNVYISVSLDTSNTSKFQAYCGDLRFTKQNGQLLPYYIVSGCGTASTSVHVQLDTFPAGAQTFYAYYGNLSADDGFSSADFLIEATSYTVGGTGSEETGPGPVAYWKFDEGSGGTANDSSGNALSGTIHGTTWSPAEQCVSGSCLFFNGTSTDYIEVASAPQFNISSSTGFTYSLWINGASFPQTFNMMMGHHIPYFNVRSNGKLYGKVAIGGNQEIVTGEAVIDINKWYHVALTLDDGYLKTYVNGELDGMSGPYAGEVSNYGGYSQYLGTWNSQLTYGFQGYLDEVKIFPYALTEDQIKTEYNLGAAAVMGTGPGVAPPAGGTLSDSLVAHWAFDEQYGQTAHDKVGNNHGTFGASTSPGSDDPTWTAAGECKVNGCLGFDGGDYVDSGNSSSLNFDASDSFSITSWFKIDAEATGAQDLISKYIFGSTAGYRLYFQSNNLIFKITEGSNYPGAQTAFVPDGQWHHLAAVRNVGEDRLRIYLDGTERASTIDTTSGTLTSSEELSIGVYSSRTSNFLQGSLDELKIYNTALAADQVKQDMNAGASVAYSVGSEEADELADGAGAPPIAEWKFDEKQGTVAYDSSGNANDGTVNGATWKSGCQQGACLEFDGTGQYVFTNNNAALNLTSALTVEAWVKTSKNNFTYAGIVSRMQSGTPYYGYELGINSTKPYFHTGGVYASNILIGNTSISDGEWHHLAGIYDGNQAYLFLDGKLDASGTRDNSLDVSSEYLDIGINYSRQAARSFDGQIDHVRIYDYARTPAQIAYDYNRGAPVAHWKFDECEGTVAHDASGNENHGTITIGATGTQTTAGTCSTSGAWANGASGKFEASLNFDGTDDYISIPAPIVNISGGYSVSAWIKSSNSGPTPQIVAVDTSASSPVDRVFQFRIGSGNLELVRFDSSNNIIETVSTSGENLNDNSWHHVIAAFDSAGTKLYIDGTQRGSSANTTLNRNLGANEPIMIGVRRSALKADYFTGQIDDVRLYNYALSPTQVQKVYNQGYGVRYAPSN